MIKISGTEKSLECAEEFMIEALKLEQEAEELRRKARFWLEIAKLKKEKK